jgi:hypothetical protein
MSNIRTAIDAFLSGKPGLATETIKNELLSRARDHVSVRKVDLATSLFDEQVDEEVEYDEDDADIEEGMTPIEKRNKAMASYFVKGGKVTKLPPGRAKNSQTFSNTIGSSKTASGSRSIGTGETGEKAKPEPVEAEPLKKKTVTKAGGKVFRSSGRYAGKRVLTPGKQRG